MAPFLGHLARRPAKALQRVEYYFRIQRLQLLIEARPENTVSHELYGAPNHPLRAMNQALSLTSRGIKKRDS